MNEYLLKHALENVWCNPDMDRQHVYKLARLTPTDGVRTRYGVNFEQVTLPTEKEYYHLYQIGKVVPVLWGLPKRYNVWMKISDLAQQNLLLMDLFVANGLQFPRFETYVRIQGDRNLVFAVKTNVMIADLNAEPLYARFYVNAYFTSERSSAANKRYIMTEGIRVKTQTELLQLQMRFQAAVKERGGYPFCYVNGRLVHEISLVTAGVGDVVEYVLDGSVIGFHDFKLTDLPWFTSELDKVRKYLIHYHDPSVQSIRFYDDVEAFLIKPLPVAGRYMGTTYHRADGKWLRMLTHKDYSVSIPRLQTFVDSHLTDPRNIVDPVRWNADKWNSLDELTLRLYFRESGYDRPLEGESNRILELYRLTSQQIVNAMVGDNATNPLWTAKALEQCPYVKFMSLPTEIAYPYTFGNPLEVSEAKEKAQAFAGDVYGYHATATILADTPSSVYVDSGNRYAELAYEHWYDATVFEYDAVGVLLGYHYHTAGRRYTVRNALATKVEAITGQGGDRLNTRFGLQSTAIPTGYNFRIYVSSVYGGIAQGDWQDITEHENLGQWGYLDDTGDERTWVWTADAAKWYGAVRIDDQFLIFESSFARDNGVMQFAVGGVETHDTEEAYTVMEIPVGQLDVYLNNRFLIENLDYVVKWPRVVVTNREYLLEGTNRVLVRGYSFCDSAFNRLPSSEIGFVKYGVLSNNEMYNIHTHKVQRVVIDGHYRDPADLIFEEQDNTLTITNERNGAPYIIQTPPVRFKDVYPSDAKAREEDEARDRLVAEYMDAIYPKRSREQGDTIERQYHVVSVFANKLLTDLVNGKLDPAGLMGHYTEVDIKRWLSGYEFLLDFDLCNLDYNETHVQVLPHWYTEPQGLQIHKYDFYVRALKLYLRKRPDISPFVYVVR